jgi:hypothetical protein
LHLLPRLGDDCQDETVGNYLKTISQTRLIVFATTAPDWMRDLPIPWRRKKCDASNGNIHL